MRVSALPFRAAILLGLAVATATALAASAMKDPLYGDPAHPNISGMWNPEFAYFGPPVGAPPTAVLNSAPPQGGAPAGATPGAAPAMPRFTRPAPPRLTPEYAKRFAAWSKDYETGT